MKLNLWNGWCRKAELTEGQLREKLEHISDEQERARVARRIDVIRDEVSLVERGLKTPSISL